MATAASTMLAACGIAPGMRMSSPATLPVESGSAQEPKKDVDVPITDINLNLIQQLRAAEAGAGDERIRGLIGKPQPYTLGVGDVLQITVWDHPELSGAPTTQTQSALRPADPASGFVIGEDGNLSYPYAGTLHVAGLRVDEVRAKLYERLATVFNRPQLTVRIASFRSQQIYVDGEVHTPGPQAISDIPMTLYDAVSRAGGFSQTADQSRMVLVRNGTSYPINFPQLLARGENPAGIVLQNGDLLRIVSRDDNGVYVMGEVSKPATAIPMRNGRLSLSDAISQVGSLNSATADAAQLYVIRGSSDTAPQVFHLDARSPVAMILANQFELQPKDVVYVDGNGLVRISRVLNLLLPAINAGLYGAIATK
ncbi:polysaccharide biosynthesis/export family protein [Burkholderia pseudomultivorans]|uniref:polysaccharide biosynthesis/export family protein n=1 Tax=Burkholderia pseudomultivorans TaxID=1207504 RepID=UPI0001FD9F1D|nr:polysaccharide biosynthesis/export family protein [Burkholderia pseudomultivorans]EGD03968.1 polysaccharide export protein [Burkholderia sp. TJI49]